MTASLSPVTEIEMNTFFNGIAEFKSRLATNFVAASEQAQEIGNLRELVHRLQSSVDALTNSVNTLTNERNQAIADRNHAQANERAAIEMAQACERDANNATNALVEANISIQTLNESRFNLEIVNEELRAMNDRQTSNLNVAVHENHELQTRIAELINARDNVIADHNALRHANTDLENRLRRLTNILVGAKAVLEDVPNQQSQAPWLEPAA